MAIASTEEVAVMERRGAGGYTHSYTLHLARLASVGSYKLNCPLTTLLLHIHPGHEARVNDNNHDINNNGIADRSTVSK